ncbi:MAG TPA: FlgD immunoglobulin-like domain containing protein [Nitrospirota bacterium]|nr:FlgD immunoglobulin-like domain containing protein [Nitrospirota bacterium]
MSITSVTSTTHTATPSTTASSATSASNQTLNETDFLQLLTAQLRNQDPLNPSDASDFAAQLAQFASVEQLTNINSELTSMAMSQTSLQNTMASDLIGKTVTMSGNEATLNGQATMSYTLPGNAAHVTLAVYDSTGTLVKTATLGPEEAGNNSYTWDGTDNNGNTLAAGQYTFAVNAVDSSGNAITVTPLTSGTVTGVSFNNNVTYLTIDDNSQVQLGDITAISGGN